MRILKRNQLIILVISLMLITAGYLNFTNNNNSVMTSQIASRDDYTIGDAELVSTIPQDEDEIKEAELVENTEEVIENVVTEETVNEKEDYYFTSSKLERNNMFSENLDTYQEIYNNVNSNAEQKADAISKINSISNTKNAIMIAENLVLAKGFEDVVIFVNEGSISVVVKAEELQPEQVAQIQNIVSRELNADAGIIHISTK